MSFMCIVAFAHVALGFILPVYNFWRMTLQLVGLHFIWMYTFSSH